jgi:hypothetical protein
VPVLDPDAVELVVPASSTQLRMCRLVASGVASGAGLDVDLLEDLRIAVDELCSVLIEQGHGPASIRLRLRGGDGLVEVDGALDPPPDGASSLVDPISRLVLDGLDVSWVVEGPVFRLTAPRPLP